MKKRVKLICIALSLLMIVTDIPYSFLNYDQNTIVSVAKKKKKDPFEKYYYVYEYPFLAPDGKKKKIGKGQSVTYDKYSKKFLKYVSYEPNRAYPSFNYRGTDEVVYIPSGATPKSFAEKGEFNYSVKKIILTNYLMSWAYNQYFKTVDGDPQYYISFYQCPNLERIEVYYRGGIWEDGLQMFGATTSNEDASELYHCFGGSKTYCQWSRYERMPVWIPSRQ